MNIKSINTRFGGAAHDSGVWNGSEERHFFETSYNAGDKQSWLLGKM